MGFNAVLFPTWALSLGFFFAGRWAVRTASGVWTKLAITIGMLVCAIPGLAFTLYYLHLFDDWLAFYQFRSISFIELTGSGVGFAAGGFSAWVERAGVWTRVACLLGLLAWICVPYLKPVLAPLDWDSLSDHWEQGVCMQSTAATCGPASVATVLRHLGLSSTEEELARECFSYRGGTENWFLARALRERGFAVTYRQRTGLSADIVAPAIAGVRIGTAGHFIAILSFENGQIELGDPLIGRRSYALQELRDVYELTGFFMEIGAMDEGLESN